MIKKPDLILENNFYENEKKLIVPSQIHLPSFIIFRVKLVLYSCYHLDKRLILSRYNANN